LRWVITPTQRAFALSLCPAEKGIETG